MPGPVADRLELMRATAANLEPILLVYDGGGDTVRRSSTQVCAAAEPLLETTHRGRPPHRLWAVDATRPSRRGCRATSRRGRR